MQNGSLKTILHQSINRVIPIRAIQSAYLKRAILPQIPVFKKLKGNKKGNRSFLFDVLIATELSQSSFRFFYQLSKSGFIKYSQVSQYFAV